MATSTPPSAASFQIDYQSQEPNRILGRRPLLLEVYSKSHLTVVTFLLNGDPLSQEIRERTRALMMNFNLIRNIQFVEQELENPPSTWFKYNVDLFRLPTIIFYSQTGEIDRQAFTNADRYEEKVRFHQRQWLKHTLASPLQIGQADFLRFRDEGMSIIRSNKVVLLINGDPDKTWCQQSARCMDTLRYHGIKFLAYDVLQHEGLFRAFQDLTQCKIRFPHIYLNGQMIGGMPALEHLLSNYTVKKVFQLEFNDTLVKYLPDNFIPALPLSAPQSCASPASTAGEPSGPGN